MNAVEVARLVRDSGSAHQIRPRKDGQGYDCKPIFTGKSRGWTFVDIMTAGAIMAVYEALSEPNRAKLEALPIDKAARICFKFVR